jgi:muramoyltetrapeptide carboxypeptidase
LARSSRVVYSSSSVNRTPLKPPALLPGSRVAVISPASAADAESLHCGCEELRRLGYVPEHKTLDPSPVSYFASTLDADRDAFLEAVQDDSVRGIFCARGGYGSTYLLDVIEPGLLRPPKVLLGFSDVTSLQAFLWQKQGWVTFYGPMVATGFHAGAGSPGGYDFDSFNQAVTETTDSWTVNLQAEMIVPGDATGVILGGCLTLIQTTLGTPWELDTADSILLLEDRAMKPYQVDRILTHLLQAGKFEGVRGFVLGEFPECEPPQSGGPTVHDVCTRILGALDVPVVWGAPIGHTRRPMLTIPLGIPGQLHASGRSRLQILEPAVSEPIRK